MWGSPGASGEPGQWMLLDPSEWLICLSSQSAGWGDDRELGAGVAQATKPTLDGQNSVCHWLGRVLTPTSVPWLLMLLSGLRGGLSGT